MTTIANFFAAHGLVPRRKGARRHAVPFSAAVVTLAAAEENGHLVASVPHSIPDQQTGLPQEGLLAVLEVAGKRYAVAAYSRNHGISEFDYVPA